MSDPLKPIGNTAASLTAPAQAPVSKGSVISTLANTILSNYGKALLLVGAVCFIGYWVTHRKSSGLHNLEPSPALSKDDQNEAREIIREIARHEAVFALVEAKNPGFIAQVEKNLTSSNMDDVRGCRALLEGSHNEFNPIAAFKLGENPWILPTVNSEERNTTILVMDKNYFIAANQQNNRTILTQLGFTDEAILSKQYSLKLTIQENRVIEVIMAGKKMVLQLQQPVAIKFIKAPKMLPTVCAEYTKEQKQFTQILINTLWLNSACENHKADIMYKYRVDSLFSKNDFKKVLEELGELCPTVCPPFSLTFGLSTFKTGAVPSIGSFQALLTSEYVENLDRPNAQFRMDKIIPLLYQKALKITGPNGEWIYPEENIHTQIFQYLYTALNVSGYDLPNRYAIREIYIDTKEVKYTWIEKNSELKSSTHKIVDHSRAIAWKKDEAK
ncbi:MAG: hypothetical protein ABSA17_00880 [Rhabdochlamydiaceae bacterium]|jgi:hypothetical protein